MGENMQPITHILKCQFPIPEVLECLIKRTLQRRYHAHIHQPMIQKEREKSKTHSIISPTSRLA